MFDKDASRMDRFNWPGVGTDYLKGDPESWTNKDIGNAINGLATGMQMALQEMTLLLQRRDLPLEHSNLTLVEAGTGEDRAVNPMSTATSHSAIHAPLHVAHPTARVTTGGDVRGAAAVFEGPIVALVAPNLKAKFGAAINQVGFVGKAALFEKLFVNQLCTTGSESFFNAASFVGDPATSASSIGTQSVTIALTRQAFVGGAIKTSSTVSAGTYVALGKMTVRHANSASTVSHVEGQLLKAGTVIDSVKIAQPIRSHGRSTSAAFACMFTSSGNEGLTMSAYQPKADVITSRYRYEQDKTGFVVIQIPT